MCIVDFAFIFLLINVKKEKKEMSYYSNYIKKNEQTSI